VAINNALTLRPEGRPTGCHCQVRPKISVGLRIWAADKPYAVIFKFAVGRHCNAA